MKSYNNLLVNLFNSKWHRPSFPFTCTMTATTATSELAKWRILFLTQQKKPKCFLQRHSVLSDTVSQRYHTLASCSQCFYGTQDDYFRSISCSVGSPLQWVNGGMDTFQRVCEASFHPLKILCPLPLGFLFLSTAEEAGLWEKEVGDWIVTECIPRLATYIETYQHLW